MPKFTLSQYIHEVVGTGITPPPPTLTVPAIATAPVLASVTVSFPVVYFSASGITGNPIPTLTHDLWKNGSLFVSNYVSGAYTATTAGDTFQIVATATNSQGNVTSNSATVTAQANIANTPVFSFQTPGPYSIGQSYFYTYQASNSPTSWKISSGALPPGFSLNYSLGVLSCVRDNFAPTPGTYNFTVSATNANGTTISNPQSIVVDYLPMVVAGPVVGSPIRFVVPGYYDIIKGPTTGTFNAIQWYANDASGSGPQAISGATGLTYTPVTGDIGKYLSVRVTIGATVYSSIEFTTPGQIITAGDYRGSTSALLSTRGTSGFGSYSSGLTLKAPAIIRYLAKNDTTKYTDNILAPGTYPSSSITAFGNTSNLSGGAGTLMGMYTLGPRAVIAQATDPAPATATRPVGNTGTGFFVTNGALYDYNGNKFRIRGFNQGHYDSVSTAEFNAKANAIRCFVNLNEGWSSPVITGQALRPLMQKFITNKTIPIPVPYIYSVKFAGTVSGNVLTVASDSDVQNGYIALSASNVVPVSPVTAIATLLPPYIQSYGSGTIGKAGTYILRHPGYASSTVMFTGSSSAAGTACKFNATINSNNVMTVISMDGANTQNISVGDWIWIGNKTCAQVASFGTSIGGVGTINLSVNVTISTTTQFNTVSFPTSGDQGSSTIIALARLWADQYASRWFEFDNLQIINIANEWGPVSTGPSDTVWRDACITSVGILRAAGFGGTIMLDAPGSGQDGGTANTIMQFAGDIYDADPQKNVIISVHLYGAYKPGGFASIATAMANVTANRGVPFIVGEFGPDVLLSTNGSRTLQDPREIIMDCEANNIPWLAWAWDDGASQNDNFPATGTFTGSTGTITAAGSTCTFKAIINTFTGVMTLSTLLTGSVSVGDYIWTNNQCVAQVTSFGTSTGGVGTLNCTVLGNTTGSSDDFYAMCKNAGSYNTPNGFSTSSINDLTRFGKTVVSDPVCGTQAIAVKASMF